jgi:hypothetical protein
MLGAGRRAASCAKWRPEEALRCPAFCLAHHARCQRRFEFEKPVLEPQRQKVRVMGPSLNTPKARRLGGGPRTGSISVRQDASSHNAVSIDLCIVSIFVSA